MSRRLITNLLIFAVAVLVLWFGARPFWASVSELRKEVKAKRETIQQESQTVQKLNVAKEVLNAQKPNVERLEQAIPSAVLVPELVVLMDNLASQNGLTMANISVSPVMEEAKARTPKSSGAPKSSAVKSVKLNFQLSGTYPAFKNWLQAVENNLWLLDVAKISFAVPEKKTASGESIALVNPTIDFAVSIDSYVISK